MSGEPDYVTTNRELWDGDAANWAESGERAWAEEPSWGIWGVEESVLDLLPDDMTGMRAIELGCGTAYVSAWMARRGASVVGIDNSAKQLETARKLADEHGTDLELIHGNAEDVPYPDESFDFAISEYGAAIWADPHKWIPEAHRLLKPGGELSFVGQHPLVMLVVPRDAEVVTDRVLRYPYFDLHRVDWVDPDGDSGTVFNLPFSEWLRLFDEVGFDVVSYREVQNPETNRQPSFDIDPIWAHDFPSEQTWRLRKR